jgi:Skp family chaperone for outer membrane proteins
MKNTIIAFVAMSSVALAFTAAAQAPAGRIVTVDLNKVFTDYYKTPIASAKIKDTAESFNKELNEMVDNYKKEIEDLNKLREDQDKPEYTAEVREQKRKAVSEKLAETQKIQRDLEEYRTSHGKILQDQQLRMRQTIVKEIQDVVDKEARDAGYQLVLDKSGTTANAVPTILFSQDSMDITDDLIKTLNKNQPKTTEAPKPTEKKDDKKKDDKK